MRVFGYLSLQIPKLSKNLGVKYNGYFYQFPLFILLYEYFSYLLLYHKEEGFYLHLIMLFTACFK
jgi:hypothetical protein